MRWTPLFFLVGCVVNSGPRVEGEATGTAPICPDPSCEEICDDGLDNDLDYTVDCLDDDCAADCNLDADGDGYTSAEYAGDDCDDTNAAVYPGAPEVCDGVDNDCDGLADEEDPNLDVTTLITFYRDADGDGYGLTSADGRACEAPSGSCLIDGDCDDDDPLSFPGAIDVPGDCIDQDCDGYTGDQGCEPVYVGEYLVDDGDPWGNNPPVYSCIEACALLFGGIGADYACSTTNPVIDYQGNTSTWGVGGCGIVAEDYSLGTNYDCGAPNCATSAYVTDNCTGATNYCFEWP